MKIRAVIFNFIGTLAEIHEYPYEKLVEKMYKSLVDDFRAPYESFREVYDQTRRKYHVIRHGQLIEVTNAVCLSETLNKLGFPAKPEDEAVRRAVNIYFEDFIRSLKPRPCALTTLKSLSNSYDLALITNFTYAPAVYASLRKLNFTSYFNATIISQEIGWRKPHPKIFEEALKRLGRKPEQAVFVGDNPTEDIKGAKKAGMKAVFVPSQDCTSGNIQKVSEQPDVVINSLCELPKVLF